MQGNKGLYHQTEQQLNSEQEIIEAAKKDLLHFKKLYNKYYEQIFRYVYQRMDVKDTAHDVTSQVFLKSMNNLKKFKYKGVPFSAWLFRIASNEVVQFYKDKKSERTVQIQTDYIQDIVANESELEREQLSLVIEEIAELPAKELELIELRYFEKRPFKEISQILNITESNAKVRIHRIVAKLKQSLKNNRL
ncbi:MAG: sigma-70 family RNA polymerase sigma factor [Flavobacteriales bacterium]|jgi:RNA polymerase sigma-70 factor, ECF subfamily|nr:sigma-70 family RNA polymerase sigma factor [Flavobacteriales bacterium]